MLVSAWLSGAIVLAALVVATFFLRFWRQTRDPLFLLFALAFALEAVHRLLQAWPSMPPDAPQIYLLRLIEYLLILIAIVHKNSVPPGK